jgi:hypothetical protein
MAGLYSLSEAAKRSRLPGLSSSVCKAESGEMEQSVGRAPDIF